MLARARGANGKGLLTLLVFVLCIRAFASDGRSVYDTFEAISSGVLPLDDLPLISVVQVGDEYYSLNNRRLWVLQELRRRGLVGDSVRVRMRPLPTSRRLAGRFAPEKCALSATFMGGQLTRANEERSDERSEDEPN